MPPLSDVLDTISSMVAKEIRRPDVSRMGKKARLYKMRHDMDDTIKLLMSERIVSLVDACVREVNMAGRLTIQERDVLQALQSMGQPMSAYEEELNRQAEEKKAARAAARAKQKTASKDAAAEAAKDQDMGVIEDDSDSDMLSQASSRSAASMGDDDMKDLARIAAVKLADKSEEEAAGALRAMLDAMQAHFTSKYPNNPPISFRPVVARAAKGMNELLAAQDAGVNSVMQLGSDVPEFAAANANGRLVFVQMPEASWNEPVANIKKATSAMQDSFVLAGSGQKQRAHASLLYVLVRNQKKSSLVLVDKVSSKAALGVVGFLALQLQGDEE
jgi:histone H3/H4